MDLALMLLGEERHCADCGVETIFVPAGETADSWVCTACDAAVWISPIPHAA